MHYDGTHVRLRSNITVQDRQRLTLIINGIPKPKDTEDGGPKWNGRPVLAIEETRFDAIEA